MITNITSNPCTTAQIFPPNIHTMWCVVEEHLGKVDSNERSNQTPLHFAAIKEDVALTKKLITMGADVHGKDSEGRSPLFVAYENAEIVEILLKAGANANESYRNIPILHEAIKHVKTCELLLDHGADINKTDEAPLAPILKGFMTSFPGLSQEATAHIEQHGFGFTPLHYACFCSETDTVRLLLERGAKEIPLQHPELKEILNLTFFALRSNNMEIAHLLKQHGFVLSCPNLTMIEKTELNKIIEFSGGINAQNESGMTLLHMAAFFGWGLADVEHLLNKGANPNLLDNDKNTPLHLAAHRSRRDIVKLLLERGASPFIVNKNYSSPILMALRTRAVNFATLSQTFPELMEAEGGFSSNLATLRLAGHRFSLKGECYEGIGPEITFPMLGFSIANYSMNMPSLKYAKEIYSGEDSQIRAALEAVACAFLSSTEMDGAAEILHKRYLKGNIVVLDCGWLNHATSIVLYKGYLAKCNRGQRLSEREPGISFYSIGSYEKLESSIEQLIGNNTSQPTSYPERSSWRQSKIHYFEQGVNFDLNLKWEHTIAAKDQTSGNCGWLAAKMGLRAALTLNCIERHKGFHEAEWASESLYIDLIKYDRLLELDTILDNSWVPHPELEEIIRIDDLFKKLLHACGKPGRLVYLDRILVKFPHLIHDLDPENGDSLVMKGVKRRSKEFITYLLDKGGDPNMANHVGITPLHVAAYNNLIEIASLLIDRGARIDFKDNRNETPVTYAIQQGHQPMVELLLKPNRST